MSFDVFTMCNPLFDIQAETPDSLLLSLGFPKGSMSLIELDKQRELVGSITEYIVNTEPGGSGANTAIGIAQLGGTASFTGRVGRDDHGRLYGEGLEQKGVRVAIAAAEGVTGICVVMVTPDAERTMGTFLGVSQELGPEDIDVELIKQAKYVYITGYLWDTDRQKEAVLHTMEQAKVAGIPVALSLSDPFCVGRHRNDFLAISEKYVDLLIGNSDEMRALTDTQDDELALKQTKALSNSAVLTRDSRGALLRSGNETIEVPAYRITPVDSTGAG